MELFNLYLNNPQGWYGSLYFIKSIYQDCLQGKEKREREKRERKKLILPQQGQRWENSLYIARVLICNMDRLQALWDSSLAHLY